MKMKNNKPASAYAKPHTMSGKSVSIKDVGIPDKLRKRADWTPMNGGVTLGYGDDQEPAPVKMRGTGAATKGTMCRGPMA